HRIAFSGRWDVPFDQLWDSAPRRLTKGWSMYPIATWRTGFPMDILSGLTTSRTNAGPSGAGDAGNVRANLSTPVVPIFDPHQTNTFKGATGSFWFDPTLFNATYNPDVFTYGTYPRNYLRGPHRTNFDFAIAKETAIAGERLTATFRAEFFNILNHSEFQLPTLNIS